MAKEGGKQDWMWHLHCRSCGLWERHTFKERTSGRECCGLPCQPDSLSRAFTGNFEVGVHIADVSYFVPEGSDLDKVAAERATSVYLVQKVKIHLQFLFSCFVYLFVSLEKCARCYDMFSGKRSQRKTQVFIQGLTPEWPCYLSN